MKTETTFRNRIRLHMKAQTTQHTPGPWKFHLGRGASPRFHIQTSAGYQIASTPEVGSYAPESEQRDANARLIAAAPELLEALQTICESFKCHHEDYDIHEGYQRAKAAIAKAGGAA